MLQLDIKTAKNFFFYDQAGRQRIFAGVDKARHKALTRAGAMVRTVARRSLRKARRKTLAELTSDQRTVFEIQKRIAKREGTETPKRPFAPSLPGEPPRMRLGLLKRFLYFAYDSDSKSVVVGPAKLTQFPGEAPSVLEFGGVSEGSRIEARPFMRPAEQVVRTQYVRLWKDAML